MATIYPQSFVLYYFYPVPVRLGRKDVLDKGGVVQDRAHDVLAYPHNNLFVNKCVNRFVFISMKKAIGKSYIVCILIDYL